MDDDPIPLSQIANEAFNPVAPHSYTQDYTNEGAAGGAAGQPTDFSGLAESLVAANGGQLGAGPGPGSASAARPTKAGKLFQDPIHGAFRLDGLCTLIFDTRQFQRLRRLKQVGTGAGWRRAVGAALRSRRQPPPRIAAVPSSFGAALPPSLTASSPLSAYPCSWG